MLRLLADENFNGSIVRGLLLSEPTLDFVRVQDVNLSGAEDPEVLDWVAREGRLLLSHDYKTIPKYAYDRVTSGLPMPGVIVSNTYVSTQVAIPDILLIALCSDEGKWEGQVIFLPLE